jgi:hypothetical protein
MRSLTISGPAGSTTRRTVNAAGWLALVITLAACGGASQGSGVVATPTGLAGEPSASPSSSPPPSAAPSLATPLDAAPTELQGRWKTTLESGEPASLTIYETAYRVSRGGLAVGGILSVTGSTATFSGVSTCAGVGTYEWRITAGTLTFTPIGLRDPCPRSDILVGNEFERLPE